MIAWGDALCEQQCSLLMAQAEQWLEDNGLAPLFALRRQAGQLKLYKLDEPKLAGISVDFVAGKLAHRRLFGGGRGEAIAKAVGVKGAYLPPVVDATAGLGRDAFVLAAIGCQVLMFERHPVVAALLADGLWRGYQDPEIGGWLQTRLQLSLTSGLAGITALRQKPDVIYLDPMFPHREKSALVKKEMRLFQHLVGSDLDAGQLLNPARAQVNKRVVVKRPDYAPYLDGQTPVSSLKTKNHRFDLYAPLSGMILGVN